MFGDFIVAAALKLNQAETMAERVCHERDVSPLVYANLPLKGGPGPACTVNRSGDVFHNKVQMNGRPMPRVFT